MAFTESGNLSEARRCEREPDAGPAAAPAVRIPRESLAKLPLLHAEAARNASLGRFLANSIAVAGLLVLLGGTALLASGGSSASALVWSLLLLAGVVAMTANSLRRPPRRLPEAFLETAAADLRAILLYTGFAWGAGAFLVLPAAPAPALALGFAIVPLLLTALLLKDEGGVMAFAGPVTVLGAAAALFQQWPDGRLLAPVILATGLALTLFCRRQGGRARLRMTSGVA
jgi:hypothetical protein